jgi:hypothetical protein
VTGTTCSAGTCEITSCVGGHYDVDGTCADGCECAGIGGGGATCAAALAFTVPLLSTVVATGNLPQAGQQRWYQATFPAGGSPKIQMTDSGGGQFNFDVLSSCSTPICSNAVVCNLSAGVYQVGVKRTGSTVTCASYTVTLQN